MFCSVSVSGVILIMFGSDSISGVIIFGSDSIPGVILFSSDSVFRGDHALLSPFQG